MAKNTSWGGVGSWYHNLLSKEGTYQSDIVLPNILRLLNIKKGDAVLDLACGEGFFSREYGKFGARVIGVDIAPELIEIAREQSSKEITFFVSGADDLRHIASESIDKVTIILAIQNIENMQGVFGECKRVLKAAGKLFLVLNHPAFRIPKASSWGYDEEKKIQYRRVDAYLSEITEEIEMEPGKKNGKKTISFHRPLQSYFKSLAKAGFSVHRLEEWTSHKKSEEGPRQIAEDRSRKEIPLFMMLEAIKTLNNTD